MAVERLYRFGACRSPYSRAPGSPTANHSFCFQQTPQNSSEAIPATVQQHFDEEAAHIVPPTPKTTQVDRAKQIEHFMDTYGLR
jgi:hypothetical protein